MKGQTQLKTGVPKMPPLADLAGLLPPGVYPTECRLLENGNHFLIIKEYGEHEEMPKAHARMWKRASSQDRGFTVVCAWGGIHGTIRKAWQLFDHTGRSERQLIPSGTNPFADFVKTWWDDARRFPR